MQRNAHSEWLYRLYAPVYDLAMRTQFARARARAIELLELQPGERVLLPGVGTGLDLELLPADVRVSAADLSPAMMQRARARGRRGAVMFEIMDAMALAFGTGVFDAVLLSLIVSVVPDGRAAFAEAWRVLRPGGRLVIFDKFLPEGRPLTPLRRAVGGVIAWLGTDPNRRLGDVVTPETLAAIEVDEPSLFGGQYRIVRLRKPVADRPAAEMASSGVSLNPSCDFHKRLPRSCVALMRPDDK